jgi:hypothetical protein
MQLDYIDFGMTYQAQTKLMYDVLSGLPSIWIDHVCAGAGCEDVLVLDGNEKLHRPMCAAPPDAVKKPPDLPEHANFQRLFSTCIADPVRRREGGKRKYYNESESASSTSSAIKSTSFRLLPETIGSQSSENTALQIKQETLAIITAKIEMNELQPTEVETTESGDVIVSNAALLDITGQVTDKILSRKGLCELHQFCRDPNWRFNNLSDEAKTIWHEARRKEEELKKTEEDIRLQNQEDLDNHLKQVGQYITPKDLQQLRKSYAKKLKETLHTLHYGEKLNTSQLRRSERQHQLAAYKDYVPEAIMDLMVLDKFDEKSISDKVLFPDAFKIENGCKKHENVDKFYDRTAGILFGMKPCGIVVWFAEMYKAESPTHAALTIAHEYMKTERTRAAVPKLIVYDRACDLEPTVKSLSADGLLPPEVFGGTKQDEIYNAETGQFETVTKTYPEPLYMVDRMHVFGHTEVQCRPGPKGIYHYSHPRFHESNRINNFKDINTQVCEHTFSNFSKYKNICKNFNRHQLWFYMHVVVQMHNERVTERNLMKYEQAFKAKMKETLRGAGVETPVSIE